MAGLLIVATLGVFRVTTDAEFALFSLVVVPVVVVAWGGGTGQGVWFSVVAVVVWTVVDLETGRHYHADWIPVANVMTRLLIYGLLAYLTATVRMQLAREHDMASHDGLTGLLNRRAFFEIGEHEALRARRYGHSLAVAFLDLDDFKSLNDRLGHDAGDRALRAVTAVLMGSLRTTDRVARMGGDEFAILLLEIGKTQAAETARKIAAATDAALAAFPPVSASIGVAWFKDSDMDFPAMLSAADRLMYEVKQAGKHGVRVGCFDMTSTPRVAGGSIATTGGP